MNIVGVTACTTGIAHTYMTKEALEKECAKRGYEIKIETQGGMGIEDEVSEEEIAEADVVILAISIGIEEDERFDEKREEGKVLTLDPSAVLKDPAKIVDDLEKL